METKDIADLFVTAIGKVEWYWNFYTGTLVFLIGWLVSTNKPLALRLKILITVGYLTFVLMNLIGLLGSYTLAEALRQDLLISSDAAPNILCKTRKVLSERSFESQIELALVIHAIVGAFVLFTVWFGRLGKQTSSEKKNAPTR